MGGIPSRPPAKSVIVVQPLPAAPPARVGALPLTRRPAGLASPVDGVAGTLYVVAVGGVARRVPASDRLIDQAHPPTPDVGHVHPGRNQGAVVRIAQDTVRGKAGTPCHRVRVADRSAAPTEAAER